MCANSCGFAQEVEGVITVEFLEGFKWKIKSSIDKDIRANLFQFAVQNHLVVLSMQKEEQSLENIFQQLTKPK